MSILVQAAIRDSKIRNEWCLKKLLYSTMPRKKSTPATKQVTISKFFASKFGRDKQTNGTKFVTDAEADDDLEPPPLAETQSKYAASTAGIGKVIFLICFLNKNILLRKLFVMFYF